MKIMSCFGESYMTNDRICEMCEIACNKQYEYCKELTKLKSNLNVSSYGCIYKKEVWSCSEREYYYTCDKFGGDCKPSEKCQKYETDKNKRFLENEEKRMLKELGDL